MRENGTETFDPFKRNILYVEYRIVELLLWYISGRTIKFVACICKLDLTDLVCLLILPISASNSTTLLILILLACKNL